jgi:hypothetical protein
MNRKGMIVLALGVAMMAGVTALGKWSLQPAFDPLGLAAYEATYGAPGMLKLLLFALGFPFGVGLCVIGAVLMSDGATRLWRFVALTLAGTILAVVTPGIFGHQPSPAYFGLGGVAILVLVATTAWYWGRHRATLPEAQRPATDLKAMGYFWFAVAAWNLCGVGGMPSYALYPELMLKFDSRAFAVGQLKSVMAALILGWLFTVLGWRRALQA